MSEIKVRVAARTLQHVQSRVRTPADCFQRFCAHFGRKSPTITVDVLPIYSVDRLHFRHEMVDSRTPNQRPSPKLFLIGFDPISYTARCRPSTRRSTTSFQWLSLFVCCENDWTEWCIDRKRFSFPQNKTKKEKKNEVKHAIKNSGKTKNGTTWFVARHFSQPPKALNLSNWLYKNKQKAIDLTAVNCLRQLPFRTASLNSHPLLLPLVKQPDDSIDSVAWSHTSCFFVLFFFLNHEPPSTFPLQRRLWISMRNI